MEVRPRLTIDDCNRCGRPTRKKRACERAAVYLMLASAYAERRRFARMAQEAIPNFSGFDWRQLMLLEES